MKDNVEREICEGCAEYIDQCGCQPSDVSDGYLGFTGGNREMAKSVWMIERSIDDVAHWWMRNPGQYGDWKDPSRWTTDPNKARQYATKTEAEHVIGCSDSPPESTSDMSGCIATKHIFMDR